MASSYSRHGSQPYSGHMISSHCGKIDKVRYFISVKCRLITGNSSRKQFRNVVKVCKTWYKMVKSWPKRAEHFICSCTNFKHVPVSRICVKTVGSACQVYTRTYAVANMSQTYSGNRFQWTYILYVWSHLTVDTSPHMYYCGHVAFP